MKDSKGKASGLVTIRSRENELYIKLDDKISLVSVIEELKYRLDVSKSKVLQEKGVLTHLNCGQRRLNLEMLGQLENVIRERKNLILASIKSGKENYQYARPSLVTPDKDEKYQSKVNMAREVSMLQEVNLIEKVDLIKEVDLIEKVDSQLAEPVSKADSKPSVHTEIIRGRIRSGQELYIHGNLLLIGDIHSGARVSATGDIYVMGKLQGDAHAGCEGNQQAIVAGVNWGKVQVRIGDQIATVPSQVRDNADGQLIIASLDDFRIVFANK